MQLAASSRSIRHQARKLTTFSKGHWENPEKAHGDKRNAGDFERWRGLARMGTQVERVVLAEQATVLEGFGGRAILWLLRWMLLRCDYD